MTSLRERQKERRRQDILDAAWGLFGERGVENTSIEEIATKAEVGPATVYNYFGSKTDLLHALLARYIEEEAKKGEESLGSPPELMADGMAALFEAYLEGTASRCTPTLIREFYMLAMSVRLDYGRQTYAMKKVFLDQTLRLVTFYKERGQIRDDVSAEEAAMVCYSAVTLPFMLFALDIGIDLDMARQQVRRCIVLAISGIGPRVTSRDETQHDA